MQKRKRYEKTERIQSLLAARGRYNFDYGVPAKNWKMPDANFRYRQCAAGRAISRLLRLLLFVCTPFFLFFKFGFCVRGKKNKKQLNGKGAICVCNHVHCLDTLFVRQAVGHFSSYHTAAAFNNRTGAAGAFIRHGGVLPFSADRAAMRHLDTEMERLVHNGKIVNFYAEQSLWHGYQAPRPLKRGAFYYAVKYDVPVLPLFCTFDRTAKGKLKKVRVHVLPPVFPDTALPRKEREAALMQAVQAAWQACYAAAYGRVPVVAPAQEPAFAPCNDIAVAA